MPTASQVVERYKASASWREDPEELKQFALTGMTNELEAIIKKSGLAVRIFRSWGGTGPIEIIFPNELDVIVTNTEIIVTLRKKTFATAKFRKGQDKVPVVERLATKAVKLFDRKVLQPEFKRIWKAKAEEERKRKKQEEERQRREKERAEAEARRRAENPLEEITSQLKRIKLGPGGRALDIEDYGKGEWLVEPQWRQRLDHYVGSGYDPGPDDDPEGWDEEGWEADYAGPVRAKAQEWLERTFGRGLFDVDVGEKGHVSVYLTSAGKRKFKVH
jgi:hypothetical protein